MKMIRSFDFEPFVGRSVCYVEGVIIRETSDQYIVKPTACVWSGKMISLEEAYLPDEMTVMKQGKMFDDWSGRVTTWEVK